MQFVIYIALTAFLFYLPAHADSSKPFGQKIKIAGILSLSSDSAELGQDVKNGMLLAFEKLPPHIKEKIEFKFEDDRFHPSQSVSAFKKLVSVDDIDALVSFGSACSNALAPLADQARIPMIAVALDPKVSIGKSWVMTLFMSPQSSARTIVPEAIRLGYKNIATITTLNDASLSVVDAFNNESAGRVVPKLKEEVEPSLRDFRVFLAKVKADSSIDAIMPNLMPGQMGLFARQTRQMGIRLPIFGHNFIGLPNEVVLSQGALKGAWYAEMRSPIPQFLEDFEKAYSQKPTVFAASGYDAVSLIGAALESSKSKEELNNYLHRVKDHQGALGTYSAQEGNHFVIPTTLKVVP